MRRVLALATLLVLAPASPAAAASGWGWPLDGRPEVTRAFDPPGERWHAGHRGVDLAAAPGAVVRAAGAGVVGYAGLLAGRGVVTVAHGELRTTYEPVTASVPVGRRVAAGDPIGVLVAGHPGCPAPACLHWGVRRGDVYLDPLSLVGGGPVRLLPYVTSGGHAPARLAREAGGGRTPAPTAATVRPRAGPGSEPRPGPVPSVALGAAALAGIALATSARGSPRG